MTLLLLLLLADDARNLFREPPPSAFIAPRDAIEGAAAFLVKHQNADGSFGTWTTGRWYEVSADVPGGLLAFQAASTALCWMGLASVPDPAPAAVEAQKRALSWLVSHGRVKRAHASELYNTWSQAYVLQAFARALRTNAPGAGAKEIRAAALEQIRAIAAYQTPDGGWGYYDFRARAAKPEWSTSFSTATMLVSLFEARDAGLPVPQKMIDAAVRNVETCRRPDGSYLYGTYMRYSPNHGVNRPQGGSLRTQACNLALAVAGREADLAGGLRMLEAQHRFAIAGVRRPVPHESWYAVSGYFYLYGHAYAGMLLSRVSPEERARYAPFVVSATLKCRQPDGSFWDYPLYGFHKFYGTAYALLALTAAAG